MRSFVDLLPLQYRDSEEYLIMALDLECYFDGGNQADSRQYDLVTLSVVSGTPKQWRALENDWIAKFTKHHIAFFHAYWGFDCKTPGCTTKHPVSFIGEHDGRPIYALPTEMPGWCDWGCMECGNIHRYTRAEMKPILEDQPPPPGWEPWF